MSDLCRTVGVGRDSFYRTLDPVSRFEASKADAAHQPELMRQRDPVTALARRLKAVRRDQVAKAMAGDWVVCVL